MPWYVVVLSAFEVHFCIQYVNDRFEGDFNDSFAFFMGFLCPFFAQESAFISLLILCLSVQNHDDIFDKHLTVFLFILLNDRKDGLRQRLAWKV